MTLKMMRALSLKGLNMNSGKIKRVGTRRLAGFNKKAE